MAALQVIASERTYTDGRMLTTFVMVSNRQPTSEEVYRQQGQLGYSPCGYGGPYKVQSVKLPGGICGVYATTWECAGSCD